MAFAVIIPITIVGILGIVGYLVYRFVIFDYLSNKSVNDTLRRYDIDKSQLVLMQRTKNHKDKIFISVKEFLVSVCNYLEEVHIELFKRAKSFQESNLKHIENKEDFYKFFTPKNLKKPEIHGGFAAVYFSMDLEIEKKIKEELNVTLRCIPFDFQKDRGKCIFTGKENSQKVIFAKSY